MRYTNKALPVFAALIILLAIIWFVLPYLRGQREDDAKPTISSSVDPDILILDSIESPIVDQVESAPEETVVSVVPEADLVATAPESLKDLLPTWLAEEGSLLHDRRDILGHSVLRSRGRYEWEEGGLLEIEISDVGDDADESLMKALGFDIDLTNVEEEGGYRFSQDEGDFLVNGEYDYEDHSGCLQIIVSGRYLVEIQIEQMPEEAFQEILDQHIPFDELARRLEK